MERVVISVDEARSHVAHPAVVERRGDELCRVADELGCTLGVGWVDDEAHRLECGDSQHDRCPGAAHLGQTSLVEVG